VSLSRLYTCCLCPSLSDFNISLLLRRCVRLCLSLSDFHRRHVEWVQLGLEVIRGLLHGFAELAADGSLRTCRACQEPES